MRVDPTSRAAHRLLCGRLAGVLFLVGSLCSIPVNQLFEPAVDPRAHVITAVGIASGTLSLLLPWDRMASWTLHLVPLIANVEVALTMWGVGSHAVAYLWYLVFVVIFAAWAFDTRGQVAFHLTCSLVVAAYSLVLAEPGESANLLGQLAVAVPILLVAAGVVVHLRERLTDAIEEAASEARRDALTGAGNYRLLQDVLGYELTRHSRNGQPLSIIVLDLDGFKSVNDTLGHPVGDRLLREVAEELMESVRDQDTVCRQGGDEFCVIAPETSAQDAAALAERVKVALGSLVANGAPLTASAGYATYPYDATSADLLLAQADLEQRREKAAGRAAVGRLSLVR